MRNMYLFGFIEDKTHIDPTRILSTLIDTVPCKEARGGKEEVQ